MRIEILAIEGCPSTAEAVATVEDALLAVGRSTTEVGVRTLHDPAGDHGKGFAGSPTILVDGRYLFPDGAAAQGLACRIYQTPIRGRGAPLAEQVASALELRSMATKDVDRHGGQAPGPQDLSPSPWGDCWAMSSNRRDDHVGESKGFHNVHC